MFYPTVHMPESTIVRALEYVSQKLTTKGIHVHLIAAGDALSCLLFKSRPTTFVPIEKEKNNPFKPQLS